MASRPVGVTFTVDYVSVFILTTSTSPGGHLSQLVPPLLLEVVALYTSDRLGSLSTNHQQNLNGNSTTLSESKHT